MAQSVVSLNQAKTRTTKSMDTTPPIRSLALITALRPQWLLLQLMDMTVTIVKQAKRHLILPHPRPVLLRASILLPVEASTSPLPSQGLKLCLNPCLSIQHPLLLALHLHLLLQRVILWHPENLLPLLHIMATLQPYPPCQIAPKEPLGPLHRKIA